MYIKTQEGLIYHNKNYFYCDDYNVMFDGINYEKDKDNGRCYRLDHSCCLRSDCDGKLVKRRISSDFYHQILQKLKDMTPTEQEIKRVTG